MTKMLTLVSLALVLGACGSATPQVTPTTTTTPTPTLGPQDPITITQPVNGAVVQRTFIARGLAEVFEGTVIIRIHDARGDLVLEGFTTAASGVERSPWEIELTVPGGVTGTITLSAVEESSEDGSDAFVTSVTVTLA